MINFDQTDPYQCASLNYSPGFVINRNHPNLRSENPEFFFRKKKKRIINLCEYSGASDSDDISVISYSDVIFRSNRGEGLKKQQLMPQIASMINEQFLWC